MHTARTLIHTALALSLLTLVLPGCEPVEVDDDDVADDDVADDDTADDDVGDDDTAPAEAMVSGIAGREYSTCPPAGNGVGDLCMFLLQDCLDVESAVASTVVLDADMSWPTNTIDFAIEGVADGSWQLFGFLDDDGAGCDAGPTSGDFFVSGNCVEVVVVDQQDVTDVAIVFDSKCP